VRRQLVICLALVAATVVVYAQTLRFDFVSWDDPIYVSQAAHVRQGLTFEGILRAFTTGELANWHPLVTLSHMLACQLFGLNPAGHHAANVLLHVANTLVLFHVLASSTAAPWRSAWVAVLFALHPLHVEPVAWVSARKDVLSTFFGFLTIWAYTGYARRGGVARYLLVALLLSLGLMSKPMLVTFPVLLLLLDYWPLERVRVGTPRSGATGESSPCPERSIGRVLIEKVPLALLAVASSVVTLFIQQRAGTMESIPSIPFHLRLANAVVSYVRYLGKLAWPSHLAVLYPHPDLPGGTPWAAWQVAGAAALVLAVTALVLRTGRRWAVVGWLWYALTLLPVSGLVPFGFEAMADRFSYVPLVGPFILIAWGAGDIVARFRERHPSLGPATAVGAVGVTLAFGACSVAQARHWRDSVPLYEHSLAVAPGAAVLHYNLANALDARGEPGEAIRHYREAVRIDPGYSEAFNNLGVTLAAQGRLDEAMQQYREALRSKPGNARAHNNLARALEVRGDLDGAVQHYREAVRVDPSYARARFNLGRVLHVRRQLDEAALQYREAVRLQPDFAAAAEALRRVLQEGGDDRRAGEAP
jgi:tetratricopeptide (TPR) repeat protein